MVLTGADPGRGTHGGDAHFKEDVAVFICVCLQAKVGTRGGNMKLYYLYVFAFLSCMEWHFIYTTLLCVHTYCMPSAAACSLGFALEQNI